MKIIKLITPALCVVFTISFRTASSQAKKKVVAKKRPTTTVAKALPPPPFATDAEIADGKDLIAKSDCLTCHKIEDKLVGPAYAVIAAKYPQDQNSLAALSQKIISGGKGVWGPVPMAPHPTISQADANKMIKYILTLNVKNPASSTK